MQVGAYCYPLVNSLFCNYNFVMTNVEPHWEWDPDKDETNRRTHGLSFETAALVFHDPFTATREDPYPYEQRWRTIGMVSTVVLMVVHTWPEHDPDTGDDTGTHHQRTESDQPRKERV